jgi:hypothetical protein
LPRNAARGGYNGCPAIRSSTPGERIAAAPSKNHARDIVAVDMFVVPTIRLQVLYIFIILGLERRRLIFANVTTNPTAEWLAQQLVNAFP